MGFTLFQVKLNFTSAFSHCKASGGYLAYIRDQKDQENVEDALRYSTKCASRLLQDSDLT